MFGVRENSGRGFYKSERVKEPLCGEQASTVGPCLTCCVPADWGVRGAACKS